MDFKDKLILAFCFIFHWVFIIALSTYILWSNPKYDLIFIIVFILLVMQWLIIGNCIISKIETRILYKNEEHKSKKFLNPSIQFFRDANLYTLLLNCIIIVFYLINILVVCTRYGMPLCLVLGVSLVMFIYFMYYRYQEYVYIISMVNR